MPLPKQASPDPVTRFRTYAGQCDSFARLASSERSHAIFLALAGPWWWMAVCAKPRPAGCGAVG
jgi:hypothetical protein